MPVIKLLLVLSVLAMVHGCAGIAVSGGGVVMSDGHVSAGVVIGNHDRDVIARYYSRRKTKKAPPGLVKHNRGLPQGLAKRDRLPRGLQERGLPGELERQLSTPAEGYVRVIVGNDVVLMEQKTRVVMDIYRDVVR